MCDPDPAIAKDRDHPFERPAERFRRSWEARSLGRLAGSLRKLFPQRGLGTAPRLTLPIGTVHQRKDVGGHGIAFDDGLEGFAPGRPIGQPKVVLGR